MKLSPKIGALLLPALLVGVAASADTDKDKAASKAALQTLNEFIGGWKGNGQEGKDKIWKEGMNWGWKFKDGDAWMAVEFTDNKQFTKGELKFLPEKKVYQLTATDKNKKELVFEGKFEKKYLTLTRVDPDSADKQVVTMSTNNDGARFILAYAVQTKGKGVEKKQFEVNATKEGQSLASSKKNECVVTGGLGTMAVSFGGKTYYVCCSGCADAFKEDAKKIIEEYEKKNKK